MKNEDGHGGVMVIFILIFSMLSSILIISVINWEICLLKEEVLDKVSRYFVSNTFLIKEINKNKYEIEKKMEKQIGEEIRQKLCSLDIASGMMSRISKPSLHSLKGVSNKTGEDNVIGIDVNIDANIFNYSEINKIDNYEINIEVNLRLPFPKLFLVSNLKGDNIVVNINDKDVKIDRYFIKIVDFWRLY